MKPTDPSPECPEAAALLPATGLGKGGDVGAQTELAAPGRIRWNLRPSHASVAVKVPVSPPDPPDSTAEAGPVGALESLLKRANFLIKNQHFGRAEGVLRQALAAPGADARPRRSLAVVLMQLGRFEHALPVTVELLSEQPDDENLMLNLGVIFFRLNRMEEAKAVLTDLVQRHPHQLLGRIYLANVYLKQPERGLEVLQPVMAQAPLHADLSFTLATLYERLQNPKQALKHYEMALAVRPEHAESLSNWLLTLHYLHPVDLSKARDKAIYHGKCLQAEAAAKGWLTGQTKRLAAGPRLRLGILSSDLRQHVVA